MNHDEIQECLEAYALGALDEPERSAVTDHLAGCEECRTAVGRYEQVTAALPAALATAAPVPPSDLAAQRIRRVIRRRAVRTRVTTIALATAAVLLVAAAAWIWRSERTLAEERERRAQLVEQLGIAFEVVDAPDRERVVLRADAEDTDANWYGKVFTSSHLPFVVVMADRLPEPASDTSYHVWLTFDDGSTALVGTLTPNPDGFAALVHTAPDDGPLVTDAFVTLQPPGSDRPTGDPILTADPT